MYQMNCIEIQTHCNSLIINYINNNKSYNKLCYYDYLIIAFDFKLWFVYYSKLNFSFWKNKILFCIVLSFAVLGQAHAFACCLSKVFTTSLSSRTRHTRRRINSLNTELARAEHVTSTRGSTSSITQTESTSHSSLSKQRHPENTNHSFV